MLTMNKQSRFFLFIYRTENKELLGDEDGDANDDAFATGISESPEITYTTEESRRGSVFASGCFAIVKADPKSAARQQKLIYI